MIKKTILMLLVLVGGVVSANAWGDMYLLCDDNSWSYTTTDEFKFDRIDDNNFKITVNASYINNSSNEYWSFRFREKDSNTWYNIGPKDVNLDVTNKATYVSENGNSDHSFQILKGSATSDVQIFITWAKNHWNVVAATNGSYKLKFTNPSDWSSLKVYGFLEENDAEVHIFGDWNTKESMTVENDYNVINVPAISNINVIFCGVKDGDQQCPSSGGFPVVNNGVYNTGGLFGIQVDISNVGYATFSSTKAVDFTNETTIQACKASVSAGKITYTPVTTVAASEGVLLRRVDGTLAAASAIIPINSDQNITAASDNAFKGITTKQKIAQIADGKTNYILTKSTVNGEAALGFYKVNASGSWCAAGTAYLAVPIQQQEQAPDFIALDGETTGIANVSRETISNNQYYTLDGRRVAQPTKGLYIVNGKKVIIK